MSDELAAAIDELGQVRMQLDLKFFEFCDEGFGVAESRRRLLTPPWRTPPLAAPRRPSPHTGRRGRRVPQVTHRRFRRPGAPQPVTHLLLSRCDFDTCEGGGLSPKAQDGSGFPPCRATAEVRVRRD